MTRLYARTAVVCAVWLVAACGSFSSSPVPQTLQVVAGDDEPPLALKPLSLKFAVIGDSGQWSRAQRETAVQLATQRAELPFDLVLMLGDNNYGDGSPESYRVQIRRAVQTAARCWRHLLRGARQPRCRRAMELSALQHGRGALLHVPAQVRRAAAGSGRSRAVLRPRFGES